jgi:hypothetical protein
VTQNFYCRLARIVAGVSVACGLLGAQGPNVLPTGISAAPTASVHCNPWKIKIYPADLSFSGRVCAGVSGLASPGLLAESTLMAGYAQWRNSPHMQSREYDEMGIRVAHMYARRTARVTAETLVGYWHHEDPTLHVSGEQGNWHRVRATFLSVVQSPDQNGKARIALAPLAGSLGSGLTSMALYQRQTSIGYGLERSGIVYSHYLIRAFYREFSPEIWSMAPRFVRKHHAPDPSNN